MRLALAAALLAAATSGATEVFSWQDPRLTESSGLVDLGEVMVTANDSGDQPRLFVVDQRGETVRTVTYQAPVRDVEALAPAGGGAVWVGDVGDNRRSRDDLAVHRVDLADGAVSSYPVAYADGRSYDAEALVALPGGRLAVITKALVGEVWLAPTDLRTDEVNVLEPVARVGGVVTDAAYDASSGLVVVRGHGDASVHDPSDWRRVGTVPLPDQPQGEAVSVGPGGRVRVSSEGVGTPVWQLPEPLAAYATAATGEPTDPTGVPGAAVVSAGVAAGIAGVVAVLVLVAGRRRRSPGLSGRASGGAPGGRDVGGGGP